jgi:hypothetical protein
MRNVRPVSRDSYGCHSSCTSRLQNRTGPSAEGFDLINPRRFVLDELYKPGHITLQVEAPQARTPAPSVVTTANTY